MTLVRENKFTAVFDFSEGAVYYFGFVGFSKPFGDYYTDPTGIAPLSMPKETVPIAITGSRDRYGKYTVINLKEYGIPMIAQDGNTCFLWRRFPPCSCSHTRRACTSTVKRCFSLLSRTWRTRWMN